MRGSLGTESVATRQRRAAVLAWRDGRARAARVAPEVVLPDAVVGALAAGGAVDVVLAAPGVARRLQRWAPELATVLATA